jgi:hypothetical protein
VRLSGVCGCGWHLKLQHLKLLLKGGDHCYPLLELEVLLLIGMFKVYDRVGACIHLRTRGIKLLTSAVPLVLSLAKAMVHDLQLAVLVRKSKCTTAEKGILLLKLVELVRNGGVVFIVCGQMHTLLHDSAGSVML